MSLFSKDGFKCSRCGKKDEQMAFAHIKNVNPYNQYDLFTAGSFCKTYNYQGLHVDTSFLWCLYCNCAWLGDIQINAAYEVTRNGNTITNYFSFVPVPFDTITVNINY